MDDTFVDTLVELGMINKSDLENAISYQWENGGKLEESLVKLGYFNETSLFTLLSRKFNYYPFDLNEISVDLDTLKLIPYWLVKRYLVIPVKQSDITVAVVMMNPLDRDATTELKKVLYQDILPFIAKKSEIEKFIKAHYTEDIVEKEIEKPTQTLTTSDIPTLFKKYTFDNFITGKCNDFAYSAALSAARAYSDETNPLFIYSEVGLGKTHLAVAIWNYVIEHQQQRRVAFFSSDKFISALRGAIESHKIKEFREQCTSSIDILLIDDIGLIAGDEVSQQHFFHIFNDLFQNSKQIVVTSDRPPKELSALSSRLRSRFEGGLIVRIEPPDLETRVAILKFKAKEANIPDELIHLIAEQVNSNVRELEGALKELVVYSKYKKESISKALIEEMMVRRSIIKPFNE